MLLYIIIGIAIVLVLWLIVSYNSFVKLAANCEEGFQPWMFISKRDLI